MSNDNNPIFKVTQNTLNTVFKVRMYSTPQTFKIDMGVGIPGANGIGLPPGGNTGQVPVKNSGDDYDISWQDQSGGGGGGSNVISGVIPGTDFVSGIATIDLNTPFDDNSYVVTFFGTISTSWRLILANKFAGSFDVDLGTDTDVSAEEFYWIAMPRNNP